MAARRMAILLALLALPASAQFCKTPTQCYAWTPGTIAGPCNAPNVVVASCDGVTPTATPIPTSPPTGAGLCTDFDGSNCHAFGPVFGGTTCAPPSVIVLACPTPTPVPTPTPIPTEPQPSYTIIDFLSPADLPAPPGSLGGTVETYIQACTMVAGVMWCNVGNCCPPIGDQTGGECAISIGFNLPIPQVRYWWCTYLNSEQLWETGCIQAANSDRDHWVVTGQWTSRPAVEVLKDGWKDSQVWSFGVPALNTPSWFFPQDVVVTAGEVNTDMWPQGILDLGGERWLYVQYMGTEGQFGIARLLWNRVGPSASAASWVSGSKLCDDPSLPMFSGIAIDKDGSLIATSGWWPSQQNKTVWVYRSRDEGLTWARTGIKFDAPEGRTLFGCGWDHSSGGAAAQPWRLTCTEGDGGGPTDGNWHEAIVLVNGATVPPNLKTKPVPYTPAPTPHGP